MTRSARRSTVVVARRAAIIAMLAAGMVGCSSESPYTPITGGVAEPAGTYMLLAVDDAPLPFDVASGSTSFTILSSVLVLDADGSWLETRKELAPGPRIIRQGGRWTHQGFGVSLLGERNVAYSGTMTATGLRLADGTRGYEFIR